MVETGASEAFWLNGYKCALEKSCILANHQFTWFEEQLHVGDVDRFVDLTYSSLVRTASRDVLTRRQSFLPWIDSGDDPPESRTRFLSGEMKARVELGFADS
jgi:D-galactarolactone cycloisomerase